MCEPISAILLKDRVLFSEVSHSHTDILEEHGIKDTDPINAPQFVKIEVTPKDGNMFSNPATWTYRVDQDRTPKWYVAECDEPRVRMAVEAYWKNHVHMGQTGLHLSSGLHWIKDCTRVVLDKTVHISQLVDSSVIRVTDSAHIGRVTDSAHIGRVTDSAHIDRVTGSAHIDWVTGSAHIDRVAGSAHIDWVTGSAHIDLVTDSAIIKEMRCYSFAGIPNFQNREICQIKLFDSALIRDPESKKIYCATNEWVLEVKPE